MRVDYYSATVDTDGSEALAWVCETVPELEGLHLGRDGAIARRCYEHAVAVLDGKTPVAEVRWGGNGGGCSVELKGSVSEESYGPLRARWPAHRVTRVDVALDRTRPGLFQAAYESLKSIAGESRPRIGVDHEGDWTWRERPGLTAYFGSTQSEARVVLYEKGFERRAKGADVFADENHVRLELRLRPQKRELKSILAGVEPAELWGFSPFTRKALECFTGIEAEPVERVARVRDFERTHGALVQQYGSHLLRALQVDRGYLARLIRDAESFEAHKAGVLPKRRAA